MADARMLAAPLALALAAVLLIGACGPAPDGDRRTVMLDGRPWTVIVAGPDGMRGMDGFAGVDGMLFDLGQEVESGAVTFVMDGVGIPVDIAWFATDGRLVGTASMVPCPVRPCPTYRAAGPWRWALEARVGAFRTLPAGARLEISP